jgi:hypothetical protein
MYLEKINTENKLKYYVVIEWPPMCRSRSAVTLKQRPDLVYKINEFTKRIISICENYKNPIQIDQNYNMLGIKTWWKDGKDLYHFLKNQENNNLRVVPELGVINQINGKLLMFKFQVKKDGIFVF